VKKRKVVPLFHSRILGFFSLFSSVRENAGAQLLRKKINTPCAPKLLSRHLSDRRVIIVLIVIIVIIVV